MVDWNSATAEEKADMLNEYLRELSKKINRRFAAIDSRLNSCEEKLKNLEKIIKAHPELGNQ